MKKIALILTSVALIASAYVFTSCDKINTLAPTVTLTGDAVINHILNTDFVDPGATAKAEDGTELTVEVTCEPVFDEDVAGTYIFTYSATDVDGNEGTAKRTVIVYNEAKDYAGTYDATDHVDGVTPDYEWVETISASSIQNNVLEVTKFAGYTDAKLKFLITGTVVSAPAGLPAQTFMCGPAGSQTNSTFSNIGGSVNGTTITITYTQTDEGNPTPWQGTDTFVKQ
ncbi:MAG: DUF5011 domain-containing protein [Bacteroidales bacterium]|jgi:hypothetical protein|nr:DUF5011 domain-containing protein [Bacteroidales bacterium]MDD4213935.1 DUF5011 domain-containing protein [Bacteroidales bacterium]